MHKFKSHRLRWLLLGAPLLALVVAAFFLRSHPIWPHSLVRRPNIVLIVIDTLRADALHSYGHALSTSPELDALAEQGVRFRRAVAQSCWTRPSFASFLTSQYPRASGISQERLHVLPTSFITLPEVLKESGYTTLGVTSNPNVNSVFQFNEGFDAYIDSGVRFAWMREEARPTDKLKSPKVPLRSAPEVLGDAMKLLDAHQRPDAPTYLQLVLMDVHEKHAGPNAAAIRAQVGSHPDIHYLASVRFVSEQIDQFLAQLRQRPGFEDTVVVITSDHGEGLRSHPSVKNGFRHGFVAYESQTVVPLILNDFGSGRVPAGVVVDQPVRLLDLMPTLLDFARVRLPSGMQGRSLRPTLRGEPVSLPDRFVVETQFRDAHAVGVYGDGFAYIENRAPLEGTLPQELHRLGGLQDGAKSDLTPQFPQEAMKLRAYLEQWEDTHPAVAPTLLGHEISPLEIEQLRSLGYAE